MDRAAGVVGSARAAMAIRQHLDQRGRSRADAGPRHTGGFRPGPWRRRHVPATVRGGTRGTRAHHRHGPGHLSADQRQQGIASLCAAGRTDQFARRVGARQTGGAAAGAGDAQAGHRDHDEEPAHRQGVPGLEPEQRGQDDDRAVFPSRTRISDRRRTAHLGRDRRSEAAAPALRRGARTRGRARGPAGRHGRRRTSGGRSHHVPQHARCRQDTRAGPQHRAGRGQRRLLRHPGTPRTAAAL